jgi:TPR repeat protein
MYHVALGNAATEYKYLIQHAPNLYNTQKENLIRNGAAEGLICKCAIDRMFRENREVDWADASNSLVHVQVLHLRSCNQKLSANAQCRDGAHHQSLRFWRAFELLGDNPLRINDKAQWKTFEDVLSGQDALLNCNSNQGKGCSNECICSCLVCSAISGNSSAIKLLGTCYHQGFGVSQDFSIALRWYSLAAVLGVASAMNSIGFLYQEGLGISNGIKVPKNIKDSLSMQWYNLAAKYGDRTAQYNIACAYYNGWGVEPDKNEAFKWYKLAAKKGDADAQAAVGDHYLIGEGVRQNVRKALFWHIKAAKGGNVMAQTTVGHHFYFGWAQADGQRDLNKSFQWHYIAAEKGLSQAQFYVGHLYMHGEGCVKSIQKAYEMWMRGTRQGNPEAMNAIAKLYEDGIDEEGIRIPRNLVVSDYWKDQALKNGLKDPRLEFKTTEHELVALKCKFLQNALPFV